MATVVSKRVTFQDVVTVIKLPQEDYDRSAIIPDTVLFSDMIEVKSMIAELLSTTISERSESDSDSGTFSPKAITKLFLKFSPYSLKRRVRLVKKVEPPVAIIYQDGQDENSATTTTASQEPKNTTSSEFLQEDHVGAPFRYITPCYENDY